ncbi:carbohydrate ABC transporter permease [Sinomonas terrae]|uniref:Carbohydrate ABC transporter permease n=1 Tax=Sinomonas terrae TaxID=2908838 RepID=A0ABS9U2N7_9MICC|nr:carbohydrate ABC transporter permease [Sinomonas terrae]MCH6470667.1 carbohydrate ABC transporter permease [Sinomonas terrae]
MSTQAPAPTARRSGSANPQQPKWTSTGGRAPSTGAVVRTALLIAGAILVVTPVLWAAMSSFKTQAELAQTPPTLWPNHPTTDNYTSGLQAFDFVHFLTNSVIVTASATVLTLIINSMAAYALSKYNFRGRTVLFLITLSTIMIPLQVILLPVYQVIASFGMVNSLWGLIIPPAATPTGVFLLRQYMLTLPDEMIEAARIDGAGEFKIFLRIILPLSRPALAVVAIFSVIWRWNDFLWPLIVAQDESVQTLPVAIARFASQQAIPFNQILAVSVVTILPIIVIFLILQRHIIAGLAQGSIK